MICKTQLWGIGVLRTDRAPLNTHVPVNTSCPELLIVWLATGRDVYFADPARAFNALYLLSVASISADSSLKTACC
jgi:hypothetical protein